jgi:hypothetical protein
VPSASPVIKVLPSRLKATDNTERAGTVKTTLLGGTAAATAASIA